MKVQGDRLVQIERAVARPPGNGVQLAPFGGVVLVEDEVTVGVIEMMVMALVGFHQDLRAVVPCLAALGLEQFAGQTHHALAARRFFDPKPFINNPSLGLVIVASRGAIVMRTELVDPAVEVEQIVASVVGWKSSILVSTAPIVDETREVPRLGVT